MLQSIAGLAWGATVLWAGATFAAPAPGNLAGAVGVATAAHPDHSGVLLLDTGAEALRQRDALIEAATRSIDAQYYIWNSDLSGRYLAARLLRAAGRGVRVRILLDDVNTAGRDAVFAALTAHPGVEIRIYNPSAARGGVRRVIGFLREFDQLNRRMHNKSFTVDGVVTIVGGRNVGDEYFDLHTEANFRDRELLATGPVVEQVAASFVAFWNSPWTLPAGALAKPAGPLQPDALLAEATRAIGQGGYAAPADRANLFTMETLPGLLWAPARLIADPPPTAEQIADASAAQPVALALRELVSRARQEILVESAYFILGDESLAAAARLHQSGVDIRALTNSLASNDLVPNHSGYARRRRGMLDAGIGLFELRPDAPACLRLITLSRACENGPGFALHSKSMVLDRRVVYIGSFNLNLRSTYLNSETALIVESPELAKRVAASIEELLRPDSSWRVLRRKGGGLEWVTEEHGREVREPREPMTSFGRRWSSGFYGMFPLEKYL